MKDVFKLKLHPGKHSLVAMELLWYAVLDDIHGTDRFNAACWIKMYNISVIDRCKEKLAVA
jgi:hypothetical protein